MSALEIVDRVRPEMAREWSPGETMSTNGPEDLVAQAAAIQPELPEGTDVDPGWRVRGVADADWALSRIAECEAEAAEVDRLAALAIERIEARRLKLRAKAERGAAFFSAEVERWAESAEGHAELLKGGKGKSRTLIYGRVGWRKAGGKLLVTDKEALAAWAAAQPVELELARITTAPAMAAIQKLNKATGEVPPGTEWEPERQAFYIETSGAEETLAKKE